tara:strand:+ start:2499 stop:3821 length:1323 start_codon:yes stop_codon:yes gene_type:complete
MSDAKALDNNANLLKNNPAKNIKGITAFVEDGQVFYRIYVNIRSKKKGSKIREQKLVTKVETFEKALEILIESKAECAALIAKREAAGDTWQELVERWELHYTYHPSPKFSKTTRDEYLSRVRKWTKPWNNIPAKDITSGMVEEMLEAAYRKGASYSRRQEIKVSINAVFSWAVNRKYIALDTSPTTGAEVCAFPGETKGEKPKIIKTLDVMRDALARAQEVSHRWFPIWFVACHTGMRSGELNGLRKPDIHLIPQEEAEELDRKIEAGHEKPDCVSYGLIHIQRAWVKKSQSIGETKGHYSREVDVNRELYWFLVDYLPKAEWGSDDHGERVFERIEAWNRGGEAAVIKAFFLQNGWGNMTFHVMRAFWATQLLKAGVGVNVIMKMGGWKDYDTMMIYIRNAGIEVKGATSSLNLSLQGRAPKRYKGVSGDNVVLFRRN